MMNTLHKSLTIALLAVSIFISGLSANLVSAQSSAPEPMVSLTPEEKSWIKAHSAITLSITDDIPPRSFIDKDGKIKGTTIDYVRLFEQKLGLKINLVGSDWATALKLALDHEVDGILQAAELEERKPYLNFTQVYSYTPMAVIAGEDEPTISGPDALCGRRVGVLKDSSQSHYLMKHFPCINVVHFKALEQVAYALAGGEIHAVFGNYDYYARNFKQAGLVGFKAIYIEYLPPMGFARIGLRNDEPLLLSIFDKAIAASTDEERERITNRWLGLKLPSVPADWGVRVNLTPEEQAWLAKKQTIHVQYWQHPPYFYLKDGKIVGVSVDLLKTVAKNTGLTLQYENRLDNFAKVLNGLKEHKKPDVVAALMPTPEREKVIRFTEPYINSPRFIFTRDDMPFVSSIKQLFGKDVAVVKDYVTHKTLIKMFPEVDLLVYNNNEAALRAVSSGEAVAFIGDLVSTPVMINEFGLHNLKVVSPSGLPDHPLAIGIRNDWPELQSILNKGLATIPPAEKAAIFNKWSSVKFDYGINPKDIIIWFLIVAVAVSSIILLFILWNKSLKKQVRQRTDELMAEIKERELAKEATRISEERFMQVTDNAQEWIWEVDSSGMYTYSNAVIEKILGYRPEELVGKKHFYELFCAEDREVHKEAAFRIFHQKQKFLSFENRNVHKNGNLVWLLTSGVPILDKQGELLGYRGTDTDITRRKQAETALAENEFKYRSLVDNALIGVFTNNLSGQFSFVNDSMAEMFDYDSSEQMLATSTISLWSNIGDRKHMLSLLKKHGKVSNYEAETVTKTGRLIHVLFSATLQEESITGMLMDITTRKKIELALKESESKYRILLENLPQKIFLKDTHFTYISCNENYAHDLGIMPEEIVGKTDYDFYPWELADKYRGDDKRILESGQTERLEEQYEIDGKRTWVASIKSTVQDERGELMGFLGTFLDITERKKAEEKLEQYQQRLKSLAVQLTLAEEQERRLISENLHDNVGQSLAFTRMQLASARKGLPKDDKRDAQFEEISQTLLTAIQDTRHLIFELSSPSLRVLGLSAAISEWMEQQVEDKHGIAVEFFDYSRELSLSDDLQAIVFRNVRELLTNVIKHAQANNVSVSLETVAGQLEIMIQDDGVGFDVGKVMPNNTTHSGFGLFSVQERMADLGGKLTIVSQRGSGSQFILQLPIQSGNVDIDK